MRITDIRLLEGDGIKILARASVVFDDMVIVHGMAILPGREGGLYLAMPRHKHSDGTYRDTAHPLNAETRKYIERCIFGAFKSGKIAKRDVRGQ